MGSARSEQGPRREGGVLLTPLHPFQVLRRRKSARTSLHAFAAFLLSRAEAIERDMGREAAAGTALCTAREVRRGLPHEPSACADSAVSRPQVCPHTGALATRALTVAETGLLFRHRGHAGWEATVALQAVPVLTVSLVPAVAPLNIVRGLTPGPKWPGAVAASLAAGLRRHSRIAPAPSRRCVPRPSAPPWSARVPGLTEGPCLPSQLPLSSISTAARAVAVAAVARRTAALTARPVLRERRSPRQGPMRRAPRATPASSRQGPSCPFPRAPRPLTALLAWSRSPAG